MRRSQSILVSIFAFSWLILAFEGGKASEIHTRGISLALHPVIAQTRSEALNFQVQAIEVTQGVRGEIPSRVAPHGNLTLPSDGAVHIANRRTIVRAYPWVTCTPGISIPATTARLWAFRNGILLSSTPIFPVNEQLDTISCEEGLQAMRGDAAKSWNFLLPSEWTASYPGWRSFTLRLIVEINPAGPDHVRECQDCSTDNHAILGGQKFVTVPDLVIQPYIVQHTLKDRDGSQITFPGPTPKEFESAIQTVHALLPVGDPNHGLEILPPTHVEWDGPLYANGVHIFAKAMIQQYLPGGSLQKNKDGIYHLFLFSLENKHSFLVNYNSDGMRLGLAWNGKPYVQSGCRGLELVHELTHAIGLSHAGNQHGEITFNPDYPDNSGRVEAYAYGFDLWEMKAIPPTSKEGETHDYMSYNSTDPAWVSIYTWKAIAAILGQPKLDV